MNLLLDVYCVDKDFDEIPLSFRKVLSTSDIARILKLSELVKTEGLYSVEYFDSDCDWLDDYVDEVTDSTGSHRIDCSCVQITDSEIKFTGIPKHCPDCCAIYTDTIEIKELGECF